MKISEILNKDINFFGNQFGDKKKERFYSQLNILLSAGVDIKTSLELIEDEQNKIKDKQLFKEIKEKVIGGSSLSEAIRQSNKFSPYEFYSLQIGEETGKTMQVLIELADYYVKKIKQKRQFINAISYPCVVLAVAFGAVFFMLKFMVPMFADIFKRFGGELPYLTKVIIQISDVISDYYLYLFLLIAGVVIFAFSQRKEEWFRQMSSSFVLKIPVMGDIIAKVYLARFCQSMSLLISSKIPILKAISLVEQMVSFYPIEISLKKIHENILRGESLYSSLSSFSIYDKRMISLLKVGEEVNQLDTIFGKLAKQYSDEVEHKTSLIGSLIEPVMIIFLGIVVGIILVAMYLPLFQLSSSFR